ncbi:MAG: FliH/SctL family protein [Bryobacteraceae bacterium]
MPEDSVAPEPGDEPEPPAGPDPAELAARYEAELAALAVRAEERERAARDQGYQAGLRDGERSGREAAKADFSAEAARILGQVTQGVGELAAFRLRVRQQMEADLVRLSIAIARRIVHRELHVDPEALLGIVKAAIDKIESRDLLRLRVSAADHTLIEQGLRGALATSRADLVSDASLPRGSLVLESTRGELDASVETQLGEIDRGLADLVGRQS